MKRIKRIEEILKKNLSDYRLDIVDSSNLHKGHGNFNGSGETHITLYLHSKKKKKINRISIHRYINSLLQNEFKQGLHSLEIKISL